MTPDGLPIVERLDERTLVAAGMGATDSCSRRGQPNESRPN